MPRVNLAGNTLRAHVIERRRRATLHTATLDEDPHPSMPRMTEAQFVESCALVRGIEEWLLKIFEVWACESKGSTWIADAVDMPSGMVNIPVQQEAIRLTLVEAARLCGHSMSFRELQSLHCQAMNKVTDNLLARPAP